ncbi:MAG: sulfite exporter TauE/SafE family protein [Syntrophobacteraceae bacterium]|nr:sulfite exporter TauE/SafE family protein [Syntrophobacteraceae bacterium]
MLAILMSFGGGVLASFTPCTYPMMPITVAFIGGKARGSKWRGFVLSSFYVLGLAIVYSALGAFAALSGQLFGALTSNRWTYLVVGNICLVFGLAMLDVVPMTPPAFLNRLKVKDLPGHDILTSIFLGGASALVVTTCTTPILGVLLTIVATRQDVVWGMSMLFAFSYGLGSLVIVVGTFTGLLAALPRSGIWMRRVQKSFGVLMILAAEYFFIKTGEFWL